MNAVNAIELYNYVKQEPNKIKKLDQGERKILMVALKNLENNKDTFAIKNKDQSVYNTLIVKLKSSDKSIPSGKSSVMDTFLKFIGWRISSAKIENELNKIDQITSSYQAKLVALTKKIEEKEKQYSEDDKNFVFDEDHIALNKEIANLNKQLEELKNKRPLTAAKVEDSQDAI